MEYEPLRPINKTLNRSFQAAFWLFVMLIGTLFFSQYMPWEVAFWRTAANLAPLAALCYFNALVLVNKVLERGYYVGYVLSAIALILAFVPLRLYVNSLFPDPLRETGLEKVLSPAFGAIITNIGVVLVSALYQVLFNRVRREHLAVQLLQKQQEAQLQLLRAQINPHFLFNTLHNIYSMAITGSRYTASAVLSLSQLLRYVIYDARKERVPLGREISHIERYVALFQMRFAEPVRIELEVSGPVDDCLVEPMLLLPLVENCCKHTDFVHNPQAFVHLSLEVSPDAGRLRFRTRNTKDDADKAKDAVGGVGLANMRARLALRYPDDFVLTTRDDGTIFEVLLEVPTSPIHAEPATHTHPARR
ncbi:MAG: histidine kinase [Bacteroidetes bacterium]|nr:MAG: histidine kinase [Bacteroidota bacterium]